MMAISSSPLRSGSNNEDQIRDHGLIGNFSMFDDEALLDDINFDDLLSGFDEGVVLPDLEVDAAEILSEFSGDQDESGTSIPANASTMAVDCETINIVTAQETNKGISVIELRENEEVNELSCHGDEVVSELRKENIPVNGTSPMKSTMKSTRRSRSPESDRSRKSSSSTNDKGSQGKRKVKVDWTPELHRRFVQAVEQLGVDKAVPSRILEIMGIDGLTRHNIASHLQKYRSHRKHLLAREIEAANLSQRRQMYTTTGTGGRRDMHPWLAPTIGFPPILPPPSQVPHVFRPLHVWGHPTPVDQPLVHMWPRPIAPRSVGPPWAPLPPPSDASYWNNQYHMRFPTIPMPVKGVIPHPTMYRPVPPTVNKQTNSQPQLDSLPSKESIDAAIGDVLDKPWLPLPLGLKPPSLDSVLGELQKQGVSKVPPSTT